MLKDQFNTLNKDEEPAAFAVVVRRDAPSSGKPGDKALITASGKVEGWIGGGCTKGIIIKEALEAINDSNPRLVRIQAAQDEKEQAGVKNYKMTCMSGGTVEVYIEPIIQMSTLRIFGRSHIAKALSEIAKAAGFHVSVISDLAEVEMFHTADEVLPLSEFEVGAGMNKNFVVVCTQGEDDEKSLQTAIDMNPQYLAFVSSKRKSQSIFTGLSLDGVPRGKIKEIRTPAGLDINAKTPEEVAISILAEIIKVKRSEEVQEKTVEVPKEELQLDEDLYINPVCKIPVQKSTAKHVLEYHGEKVYFCCDGCKESFEKDPAAYME